MTPTNIPYVCLYRDYFYDLAPYSDEEVGRIFRAMLAFLVTGCSAEFTGQERFIWPTLRSKMLRDMQAYQERCEKNRRNGAKGGRPRRKAEEADTPAEEAVEEATYAQQEEETAYIQPEEEAAVLPADAHSETIGFENKTQCFFSKPKKPNYNHNQSHNQNYNYNHNHNHNHNCNQNRNQTPAGPIPLPADCPEQPSACRSEASAQDHGKLFPEDKARKLRMVSQYAASICNH